MTIPFNSFNKEYLKQYLIGPASRLTSYVGNLNLSIALGLKFRLIQCQDMKDLSRRVIRAPITMNTYVRMSP